MKKTLTLLLAVVLVLGMVSINASAKEPRNEYTAGYTTTPPTIDGAIDAVWSAVQPTNVDLASSIFAGTADASPIDSWTGATCRVRVLHDGTYLYFLAEVTDATIQSTVYEFEDPDLVGKEYSFMDSFELYLDEDNCQEFDPCDYFNQLRFWFDGTFGGGAYTSNKAAQALVQDYKLSSSSTGYVFEIKVKPLESIPTEEGGSFGLEFCYVDCKKTVNSEGEEVPEQQCALRWNVDADNGDTAAYSSPEAYGILYFDWTPIVVDNTNAGGNDAGNNDAGNNNAGTNNNAGNNNAGTNNNAGANTNKPATTPNTADAGIVVASLVMAAAAAVVLTKKH